VFSREHKTDRTTCLSEHVAIYVMALTPFTGRIPAEVSAARLLQGRGLRTGGHVHGLAGKGEQQAQDLGPVALKLLGGGNGRVAAHAALPYGIRDLVLARRPLGQREVGEEEEVDQRVDDLLGKRLRILEVGLQRGRRLLGVGLVEDDLAAHQLAAPTALPARGPEELVLPLLEVVGLVQERQQAREHADAVEGVPLGRKLGVGEGGVVAQHNEARRHGEDQRLEVGEVVVARAADVGGREEREDILSRLGQLPELSQQLARRAARGMAGSAYAGPVGIVGGDFLGLRQAEDALLEGEFGVGGAHWYACQGYERIVRGGEHSVVELGSTMLPCYVGAACRRAHMLSRLVGVTSPLCTTAPQAFLHYTAVLPSTRRRILRSIHVFSAVPLTLTWVAALLRHYISVPGHF
jgi:hypothetical protein